jgi:hypothetical protein
MKMLSSLILIAIFFVVTRKGTAPDENQKFQDDFRATALGYII